MQGSTQLEQASKQDLIEDLTRFKLKQKKAADESKARNEKLVESAATVVTAGALANYLGSQEKAARKAPGFAEKSEEDQQKAIADAQGIAGIDLDLVVGVGGLLVGLTEIAGSSSGLINAAGLGALASYAGRSFYAKALNAPDEAAE